MNRTRSLWIALLIFGPSTFAATHLATVNKTKIDQQDLWLMVKGLSEGQKKEMFSDSGQKRRVLMQAIDRELIYQAAKKANLPKEPAFRQRLADAQRDVLVSYFLEKRVEPKITESNLRAFFGKRKADYTTDRAQVRHIVLPTEAKARQVLKLAKKPKSDFAKLAVDYSIDPLAKQNEGDLGWISRGQYVPEFTNSVFRSPKGAVVGPVQTVYGYHVIKVINKRPGKRLTFEEAEPRLASDYRKYLIAELVGKLTKNSKIAINEKAL
jgi:peptidyl-prolyl cis-trans isomerase C